MAFNYSKSSMDIDLIIMDRQSGLSTLLLTKAISKSYLKDTVVFLVTDRHEYDFATQRLKAVIPDWTESHPKLKLYRRSHGVCTELLAASHHLPDNAELYILMDNYNPTATSLFKLTQRGKVVLGFNDDYGSSKNH